MQGMNQNRTSTIDVPVRILVPSESVGAIIGKGGQTIRQLTQQTRAKVDVYRGDPMTPTSQLQEKVITIRGQPENCINACREILKVMKTDAENKGKPNDITLKVLAHNDYIGRIIGKQGNIINTIKKDTDTTVTVSSINDISMNVERVITVKGELENMIKALEIIHQKIKSAFENDTKTFGAQAIMMGGIPPLPMGTHPYAAFNQPARFPGQPTATPAAAYSGFYPPIFPSTFYPQGFVPPQPHPNIPQHPVTTPTTQPQQQQQASANANTSSHPSMQASASQQQQQPQQQQHVSNSNSQNEFLSEVETVFLYIPNVAVGAIIGTKGSFIKNIIKLSGASVKITPLSPEESKNANERQVAITGTRESQWKAQYYIYEKLRQERYTTDENVKLRVELHVPPQIVGRIIGRSGRNVRELQRSTGATIKLPEDANQSQSNFVVVRIIGTFNSSQLAQQRIQIYISQSLRGPPNRGQNLITSNSNTGAAGGVQIQNVIVNQSHNNNNNNNNNRPTNGNNRKPYRQYQNGPAYQQQNPQQQQQQQQQSSQSANSTPTATTPTANTSNTPTAQQQSLNTSSTENQTQPPQQQQQQQPTSQQQQPASQQQQQINNSSN